MRRYFAGLQHNRALAGIILLSLFLNAYGIWWSLPYPVPITLPAVSSDNTVESDSTGQSSEPGDRTAWMFDVVSPVAPLAAAKEGFSWGRWSGQEYTYPLAHYILLAVCYAPYVAYLFLFGGFTAAPTPGYPYGLTDPITSLTILELIARLVAVLMGTGLVVISFLMGKELFGKKAGLLTALIVALCYPLVFYAKVPTLDVPYLFWFMLALYCLVLAAGRGEPKHYLWLGVFAALSLATKDQAYGLIAPLPVLALWFYYRRHSPGLSWAGFARRLWRRELIYGSLGFGLTYTLANNLLFNWPRAVLHFEAIGGRLRQTDRLLDPTLPLDHLRLFQLVIYFLIHSLGLPLFIICVAGLGYTLYSSPKRVWLIFLPIVSYAVLFLDLGAFYVHSRFVMPIAVLLAPFGGKVLADLIESSWLPRPIIYPLMGAVFVYTFLYAMSLNLVFTHDSRQLAQRWLEENVRPGATIEVYSDTRLLPHFTRDYRVYRASFEANNYPADVQARQPDYIMLTEQVYRKNGNRPEAEVFPQALRQNAKLQALLAGHLGYELRADFKYRPPWLPYPDIFFGHNPRILIFERETPRLSQQR